MVDDEIEKIDTAAPNPGALMDPSNEVPEHGKYEGYFKVDNWDDINVESDDECDDVPLQNEDPKKSLKLSVAHEEKLVVRAVKLGSAAKGIKWYYQTYRPDDYNSHNQKRDWNKNCRLKYSTIQRWMDNFNKTGYHRKCKVQMMERPESVTISTITLTEYQKYALVNTVIDGGMILKTIKARVQNKINILIVLP